jgi:hypothetical protein
VRRAASTDVAQPRRAPVIPCPSFGCDLVMQGWESAKADAPAAAVNLDRVQPKLTLACSSGVLEALRNDAAALGKLGHDLFVQPDIHLGRAVEAAFVAELLRKLLAGGET